MNQCTAPLFDTHCHLEFAPLCEEVPAVLARAEAAGVRSILAVACLPQSWTEVLRIAEEYAAVWVALGVHPNDAGQVADRELQRLRELAAHPKVAAIGETGLDYYRDQTPREVQRTWFTAQWQLARELHLPVVLHCRDALSDLLEQVTQWVREEGDTASAGSAWRGVLHCFSGDIATAVECCRLGLMLGIGGPLTYPRSEQLRAAVAAAPTEALLLETDAPFLAPQPRRGKPNEPAFVRHTAERLAALRGLTLDQIAELTTANARRLFARVGRG